MTAHQLLFAIGGVSLLAIATPTVSTAAKKIAVFDPNLTILCLIITSYIFITERGTAPQDSKPQQHTLASSVEHLARFAC